MNQTTHQSGDQAKAQLGYVHRGGLSVLLLTAGMEICRLYAAASLLYLIPESPPYPFAALACVLIAGILLKRALSFVSVRRIIVLLVNCVVCGLFVFFLSRSYSGYAFWLNASAAVFFFFRGYNIGAKGVSHSLTITRYDTGIGVFLFVYFLRIYISEADPLALRVVGAYFLLSILAMAASRFRERDTIFTGSSPAISHVIPFIAVFFLAGTAIVLLYPLLTRAAGNVYTFLSDNSGPVVAFLIAIIRFIFGFGRRPRSADSAPLNTGSEDVIPVQASEPGIFFKIIMGVLVVIAAAAFIVMTAILVRALLRYLAEKKGGGPGLFAGLRILCRFLWDRLKAALRLPYRAAALLLGRRRPLAGAAQEAFRKLCAWGSISGLPRKRYETPDEYIRRLVHRFPSLEEALPVFARAVEDELYGRRILAAADIDRLKAAQGELASPVLFPHRFASRLGIRRK